MENRSYNPYIMGKKVFDLCEKKIPAIEEEVGQHGIDISILGSQNESQERDITEIKSSLISIAGSLNSMSTRVTALETPKAISSTPFETGETYKGKPVKKVSLALSNLTGSSISTSAWSSLGVTLAGLNVGQVLDSHIIDAYGYVAHIPLNFKQAILSDSDYVTAKRNANDIIDKPEALVFEYIEKDPAEVSSN